MVKLPQANTMAKEERCLSSIAVLSRYHPRGFAPLCSGWQQQKRETLWSIKRH